MKIVHFFLFVRNYQRIKEVCIVVDAPRKQNENDGIFIFQLIGRRISIFQLIVCLLVGIFISQLIERRVSIFRFIVLLHTHRKIQNSQRDTKITMLSGGVEASTVIGLVVTGLHKKKCSRSTGSQC